MSQIFGSLEHDGKAVVNNMITNAGAMFLYEKFLKQYVAQEGDSELLNILKTAGVITGVEELKAILARAGYNLALF